jgi:hypothetical protein
MQDKFIYLTLLFIAFNFNIFQTTPYKTLSYNPANEYALKSVDISLYNKLADPDLSCDVFLSALNVHQRLLNEGQLINHNILTIIDFSKPSSQERLFVIDLEKEKIIFKTLVAHGKNSGENYATRFSNNPRSHQSSLGFYITESTYMGRHGYSLRLNGIEGGFNDNAKNRAIVMHGADYVSKEFIASTGRLGRSFGCPALPPEIANQIIDTIKEKSLLFIYARDEFYCKNSSLLSSFSSSL